MLPLRKVLSVAEKPSIAKKMAFLLSSTFERGFSDSKYNPVFLFSKPFLGEQADHIVTSVTGHFMEFKFDSQYKCWESVDPEDLLMNANLSYVPNDKKLALVKNLKRLSLEATDLFLWLDCDREGEAIAYEVIEVCKETNPQINIHRAKFSALTKRDLQRAFDNPIDPDPLQSEAVLTRQEVDLRSGAAFTRFQTLLLRSSYPNAILAKFVSYGSCQFPTLSFIVERYLQHINFENSKFWYIDVDFKITGIKIPLKFIWDRQRLDDKYVVSVLYVRMMQNEGYAIVTDVKKVKKSRYKPMPLTTIEFQKKAVSKLKLTSDQAMKAAEGLYQKGIISYPRTETNRFPNSMSMRQILKNLQNGEYSTYIDELLGEPAESLSQMEQGEQAPQNEADQNNGKYQSPRRGGKDDQAHPPIHPVKPFSGDRSSHEYKVYDFICRHFLACCSMDALLEETTINIRISDEGFHLKGIQLLETNFLDIYDKFYYLKEQEVPDMFVGQEFLPTSVFLKEGLTSPPKLLSEGDLISLMDKHGVGTDATIHEHIKNIQIRKYAKRYRSVFKPTQLGIALLIAYNKLEIDLTRPTLRAQSEQDYTKIEKGEKTRTEILGKTLRNLKQDMRILKLREEDFLYYFKQEFDKHYQLNKISLSDGDQTVANPNLGTTYLKCDKCDAEIIAKMSAQGNVYLGCENHPKCKTFFFFTIKVKQYQPVEEECDMCCSKMVWVYKAGESMSPIKWCLGSQSCPDSIHNNIKKPNNDGNDGGSGNNRTRAPARGRGKGKKNNAKNDSAEEGSTGASRYRQNQRRGNRSNSQSGYFNNQRQRGRKKKQQLRTRVQRHQGNTSNARAQNTFFNQPNTTSYTGTAGGSTNDSGTFQINFNQPPIQQRIFKPKRLFGNLANRDSILSLQSNTDTLRFSNQQNLDRSPTNRNKCIFLFIQNE